MKIAKMAGLYGILLAVPLTGCLVGENKSFFSHKYVCNALGDDSGSGIKGTIHYLTAAEVAKGFTGVSDFLGSRSVSPDVDFYMGRFNQPTRPFSEGFKISNTGEMVKDLDGNDLVENFAFHFTTKVRMPAGYAGKNMQFAILSDDGARLIIHRKQADGTIQRVVNINNDGNHPTRMGCGTAPVWISPDEDLDIEVDYYQGPRYHIALTMIWREWPSSGSLDTQCNKEGNDYFWDSTTTPSTPLAPYTGLGTRGWKVVPSEAFIGDGTSPCEMLGIH